MITSTPTLIKAGEQSVEKLNSNYSELIALLDNLKPSDYSVKAVERMLMLDKALGSPSSKIDLLLVGGTNGKSSTINFSSCLLVEEGFKTGTCYSSHILSYNERICVNSETILNKPFSENVNHVLTVCEQENIQATAFEVTTLAALLYFIEEKCDVALLEVAHGGRYDATAAFNPKIVAITRVAHDEPELLGNDLDFVAQEMVALAKPNTLLISAEQSKLRLQKMKDFADSQNIAWSMPIRKLAALPYIYEQLYGRTASLGERIAHLYLEKIKGKFSPFLKGNLLATKQGQRGRPTLEAKRNAQLNPIKTLKTFWNENFNLLRGRFEILDKEKPSILLDNSDNVDALNNLFLGIRLLHYQRPLKGLVIILNLNSRVNVQELLKSLRYLVKKVSGSIFFIDVPDENCHNPFELAKAAEEMNIKAQAFGNLKDAFNAAKNIVDERSGLIALAGSTKTVSTYWKVIREVKKL